MLKGIAEYEFIREIGVGGKARVYLAHKKGRGREFAVKCYFPAPHYQPEGHQVSKLQKDFQREVGHLDGIDSPYVVTLHDYGVDKATGVQFLVMDYLSETLKQRAARNIPLGEKLKIISCIAKGIEHIHEQNVIHNDLKPSNIMFKGDIPVIMDLGISKSLLDTIDYTDARPESSIQGTLPYMAPEVLEGNPGTVTSDAHALGLIAYELLTGKNPFYIPGAKAEAIEYHIRNTIPKPPAGIVKGLPEEISNAINGLLSKKVEERESHRVKAFAILVDPPSLPISDVRTIKGKITTNGKSKTEKPVPVAKPAKTDIPEAWVKYQDRIVRIWKCRPAKKDKTKPLAAAQKGRIAAVGGDELLLLDLPTGTKRILKSHSGYIDGVELSAKGHVLLSWTSAGNKITWDTSTGAGMQSFHNDAFCAALSPDGRFIAMWDRFDYLLWNSSNGRKIRTIYSTKEIDHITFGTDNNSIFGYTKFNRLLPFLRKQPKNEYLSKLWSFEVPDSKITTISRGFRQGPMQLHVNLITGHEDGSLRIWETGRGKILRSYIWHDKPVNSVDVNPESGRIVSCAGDGKIILWNLKSGECISEIETPSIPHAVAFALDGDHFISSHQDGAVVLWKMLP